MRVFWAEILRPELLQIYENMRSLPTSPRAGRRVGWDMLTEWLNAAITEGVMYSVSPERIEEFVRDYDFMDHVRNQVRKFSMSESADRELKNMDTDVAALVALFRKLVGPDWKTATKKRDRSHTKLLAQIRHSCPWITIRETMTKSGSESVASFVADTMRRPTHTWYSFAP